MVWNVIPQAWKNSRVVLQFMHAILAIYRDRSEVSIDSGRESDRQSGSQTRNAINRPSYGKSRSAFFWRFILVLGGLGGRGRSEKRKISFRPKK